MSALDEALRHAASILDAPGDWTLPSALEEVDAFRSAARFLASEADLGHEDRVKAITRLGRVAIEKAELPAWCVEAITAEWTPQDEPEGILPLSREQAARRLLNAGYVSCPTCFIGLPHELTIERSARLRAWAEEDERVRRGAVRHERS